MTAPARNAEAGLTPVGLMVVALRAHRRLLRWGVAGAAVAGVITILTPRTWTATAVFAPASPDGASSQLAGLAAQFGVSVGSGGGSQGPEFYTQVARSREILLRVVRATYSYDAPVGLPLFTRSRHFAGTLADLYEIDPATPAAQRDELAVQQLLDRLTVQDNVETGLVRVDVTAPHAAQAAAIAQQIISALNAFNVESRRSQAKEERQFVEERLAAAEQEVRQAEGRLQAFLQRNQQFRQSSGLAFEQDRLQQEVALRRSILTSLAQAYEQSRIEEVRSTPVLSIVEQPREPPFPARRRLPLKVVLGGVLGALLAALGAVGVEARAHLLATSAEWRDLEGQLARLSAPLRRRGQRRE